MYTWTQAVWQSHQGPPLDLNLWGLSCFYDCLQTWSKRAHWEKTIQNRGHLMYMYTVRIYIKNANTIALPACHQNCFMGPELLPTNHNGDISQEVSAAESIEIEQHVTSMASEFNAAICCTRHIVHLHKNYSKSIKILAKIKK